MTHKPNRVHKATGIIAKFKEDRKCYTINNASQYPDRIPAEIVEGEGWEEEKSEIDELVKMIHDYNSHTRGDWTFYAKELILQFAKNYKEQKS